MILSVPHGALQLKQPSPLEQACPGQTHGMGFPVPHSIPATELGLWQILKPSKVFFQVKTSAIFLFFDQFSSIVCGIQLGTVPSLTTILPLVPSKDCTRNSLLGESWLR